MHGLNLKDRANWWCIAACAERGLIWAQSPTDFHLVKLDHCLKLMFHQFLWSQIIIVNELFVILQLQWRSVSAISINLSWIMHIYSVHNLVHIWFSINFIGTYTGKQYNPSFLQCIPSTHMQSNGSCDHNTQPSA